MLNTESQPLYTRPYFVGLDILRLIAALAVVLYHLQLNYWNPLTYYVSMGGRLGRIAVSFFFLLSGFLLTYLMFLENNKKGKVDVLKFYIRRALRIWPLYFAVLILAFWVYPFFIKMLTGYSWTEKGSPWMYFLYLCNFEIAYRTSPVSPMLGVQWSLAVEEQFYLFLPWIFLVFHKSLKLFIVVCLSCILFSLLFRTYVTPYYDTFSVMYSLFAGVLLALLASNFQNQLKKFMDSMPVIIFCAAYVLIFLLQYQFLVSTPLAFVHKAFQSVFEMFVFSFFVFHFAFTDRIKKAIMNSRFLTMLSILGKKYTYSVYLCHMIAIVFATLLVKQFLKTDNFLLFVGTSLFGLVLICFLAERFIENKFDRMKERFYQS